MPSRLYSLTQAAIVLAVAMGSAPLEVGTSVEPKADTTSLMPAAAYSDLMLARWLALKLTHSSALSQAPSIRRNESAKTLKPFQDTVETPQHNSNMQDVR
jgi:hypothetical protein